MDGCFICAVFPESTSHVKVSCICHFLRHIMESEQIEHSSWGNINITLQNQILLLLLLLRMCTLSNWERHQFSPDGPELLDLWFKNELSYETQLSDLSAETAEFRHDEGKKRANLRLLCFSYLLFVSPCFPLSLNPPSHMVWDTVCHLFFDAWSWSKTLIWQCCTASTVSSLAEPWTTADGDPRLNVQPDYTFTLSCPWIEIIAPLCLSSSW